MFEDRQAALVSAALDAQVPGAAALGALEYVVRLLTALDHDPPRVWAGVDDEWIPLGPWERHAWAQRIGAWRAVYARVIDGVATPEDDAVVHEHACEAVYGDPAYGGNRDEGGWARIDFPAPLFPPRRVGGSHA